MQKGGAFPRVALASIATPIISTLLGKIYYQNSRKTLKEKR